MTTEELKAWAEKQVQWVNTRPDGLEDTAGAVLSLIGTAILSLIAEKEAAEARLAEAERLQETTDDCIKNAREHLAAIGCEAPFLDDEAGLARARVKALEGALRRLLEVGLFAGEGVAEARAALAGEGKP